MKTIKEFSETLNEAPKDVWGKQYKKLQGEFKTLAKHLNAKIKNTIQVKSGHEFNENDSLANIVCDSIKDIKDIIKE